MRLTLCNLLRNNAHMKHLSIISDLEKQASANGVPIYLLCQQAGIARSTWTRWKSCETSPQGRVWGRVESAARDLGLTLSNA
jgi:hypothetical protein